MSRNGEGLERLNISRMTREQLVKKMGAKGLARKLFVDNEPEK